MTEQKKCSGCKNDGFCGFKVGTDDSILLIGEAPGKNEIEDGEPFIGKAGELLNKLLSSAGITRDEISIANVMCCRPFNPKNRWKDRKPSYKEQVVCIYNNLDPFIYEIKPKVIIAAGATALEALSGGTKTAISKWSGSLLSYSGIPLIPILHPAAILRDQWEFVPVIRKHIKKARSIAEGTFIPVSTHFHSAPKNTLRKVFFHSEIAVDMEGDFPPSMVGFGDSLGEATALSALKYRNEIFSILNDPNTTFIFHNGLYDIPRLRKWLGVKIDKYHDTMLAAWILHSDLPVSLAFMAQLYTDKNYWKWMKPDYGDGNSDALAIYNCHDVDTTWRTWQEQKELLKKHGTWDLYTKIVMPMAEVIMHYNSHGLRIDTDKFMSLRYKYVAKANLQEYNLSCELDMDINLNSWQQIIGAIKAKGIPAPIHPSTKEVSTGEDALKYMIRTSDKNATWYPWMKSFYTQLIEWRETETFLRRYLKEDILQGGRIYPQYLMHRAEEQEGIDEAGSTIPSTGRFSTRNPSIQNLPKEGNIRDCILPDYDDWSLVCIDYKQIELLMALYESGAHAILRQVCNGLDIHRHIAMIAYKVRYEDVSHYPQRWNTKRTNYGLLYGAGDEKLAAVNDIPAQEVTAIRKAFFELIPQVKVWQESLVERAMENHYVQNRYGRRRYFWYKNVPEILDTIPQGQAADYLHSHIVDLFNKLPDKNYLLGEVHDEVIMQCPDNEINTLVILATETLSKPDWAVNIAIPVEVSVGKNYGELKEWEEKNLAQG